jgi:hypothetical protein
VFCYGFYEHDTSDQRTFPGYPPMLRPRGHGERYRITARGPGVTPIISWEGEGLPDYDPNNHEHVERERAMNELQRSFNDPKCRDN